MWHMQFTPIEDYLYLVDYADMDPSHDEWRYYDVPAGPIVKKTEHLMVTFSGTPQASNETGILVRARSRALC